MQHRIQIQICQTPLLAPKLDFGSYEYKRIQPASKPSMVSWDFFGVSLGNPLEKKPVLGSPNNVHLRLINVPQKEFFCGPGLMNQWVPNKVVWPDTLQKHQSWPPHRCCQSNFLSLGTGVARPHVFVKYLCSKKCKINPTKGYHTKALNLMQKLYLRAVLK